MSDTLLAVIVLAQQSRWRSLGRGVRGKSSDFDTGDIVFALSVLAGIAVAIWLMAHLLNHSDRRRRYNRPQALFRDLCRVHDLDRGRRRMLRQIARWQRLGQPARLFLEPERFEPDNVSPKLRASSRRLTALRDKLFTVAPDAVEPDTAMPDTAMLDTAMLDSAQNPAEAPAALSG